MNKIRSIVYQLRYANVLKIEEAGLRARIRTVPLSRDS